MTDKRDLAEVQQDGGLQCAPLPAPIDPGALGSARVVPDSPVEAGSWQTFTLVYTAGRYGIDDSGALRVCFRFAADHSKPQFHIPEAPGYTTIKASNDAVLECRFDQKGNVRPFDQTIYIKVVNGYLKEGDTITVTLGDQSRGSPGMRVQTFAEESFEFHVLVDPLATFTFQSLPAQPTVEVVAGLPVRYMLGMPTLRRRGEKFSITVKGEDRWGNPSNRCDATFNVRTSLPVTGLPERLSHGPGQTVLRIDDLHVEAPGLLEISLSNVSGNIIAGPQRMVVAPDIELLSFWADFHAQSEETIGTGSVGAYFDFARAEAFLDIASHQGNDFQIGNRFWGELNTQTKSRNEAGRFITLPGYEWSGNTALGGDRNVFFAAEGRPMRRSSHALVADRSDIALDCGTASELFEALAAEDEDAICFAHCGGRYADIRLAHDIRYETAVEVHSSWGTFEWLLHDALASGYRVGVVCNSDGHKGRPGAEYPGASGFGAIGGLTCMLIPELNREAVFEGLRKRHHYGTTGGPNGRLHLSVEARLLAGLCDRDPALGEHTITPVARLMMGDIAKTAAETAEIAIEIVAGTGVERVDLFNGLDHLETIRNYTATDLGRRVRVLMEGASYRGRFRQVNWTGSLEISGAVIEDARPINFFNPDRELVRTGSGTLEWELVTTGNFGGFDVWVDNVATSEFSIATTLVSGSAVAVELGLDDRIWQVEGPLPRTLRLFRLPDAPLAPTLSIHRKVQLAGNRDNAIYARVTLEDGTRAWSSPIYLLTE